MQETAGNNKPSTKLGSNAVLMLWCIAASQTSDAVFRMAVAWWLLDTTGSPALFGVILAAGNVAMTLSHATLGWLGDR
ncbi:MAG: hypothetical protein WCH44_15910, partial [Betaproteobacteria bacterium]